MTWLYQSCKFGLYLRDDLSVGSEYLATLRDLYLLGAFQGEGGTFHRVALTVDMDLGALHLQKPPNIRTILDTTRVFRRLQDLTDKERFTWPKKLCTYAFISTLSYFYAP